MGLVYNTPPESGYSEETLADGKKVFTSTTRTNENKLTSFNLQYPNNYRNKLSWTKFHEVCFLAHNRLNLQFRRNNPQELAKKQ